MPSPNVLLPYQQRWIQDKSPIKVIEKSRRIGISWAEAADCAILAAQTGSGGSDVYYLGYNESMAQLWIEDVAFWSRHYQLAASLISEVVIVDDDKSILTFQIRFASGYKVTALSSRPNNLRGKQGKIVLDEAAFHPDLEELLKAAIALLMWGGQISIISTHNGIDNPFNQLVENIRTGKKTKYSLHRVTVDDAVREGLYKRICGRLNTEWSTFGEEAWRKELFEAYGDSANEELLCIPRSNSEIYFPSTLVEGRMSVQYSVVRLNLKDDFNAKNEFERRDEVSHWLKDNVQPLIDKLPIDMRSYYGMDFGRTNDLTSIAPILEMHNLRRYCPFIVELRNVPIRQQEQILYFIADRLPNFCGAAMDARGNGQAIAEFATQRYGSRIISVMLTPEKYRIIMPRYKTALEDNMFLMPKDADILADHRAVRLENGVPKIPDTGRYKGSDGNKRHGDSLIALAFGYYAAVEKAGITIQATNSYKDVTPRTSGRDYFPGSSLSNGRGALRNIF